MTTILRAKARHPVTGRRIYLRARTRGELEAYRHQIESYASQLRLNLTTADEVSRALRRLEHGIVTLERAAIAYAERPELAPNTRGRARALLETHFGPLASLELVALEPAVLTPWLERLRARGLAGTTITTTWRTLRAIVRYAAERGWIGAAPWGVWRPTLRGGRAPRAPREAARSLEELARLIEAARRLDADLDAQLEAKIATAGLLGLRQGELAGLRWSDMARKGEGAPLVVTIERQWQGAILKGRRRRVLETIDELAEILERHGAFLRARDLYAARGPVFPSPVLSRRGAPAHYASGRVLSSLHLRAAVRLAGLPEVGSWSPHSLRDTFVTLENQMLAGDLAHVAQRSGHSSIGSLVRYLRSAERGPASPGVKSLPSAGAPLRLVAHRESSK